MTRSGVPSSNFRAFTRRIDWSSLNVTVLPRASIISLTLHDLADRIADAFSEYRDPEGFKQVSLVIDDSDSDAGTLIVHVKTDDAASLADEVEEFCVEQRSTTQREHHASDDVRVLATL